MNLLSLNYKEKKTNSDVAKTLRADHIFPKI